MHLYFKLRHLSNRDHQRRAQRANFSTTRKTFVQFKSRIPYFEPTNLNFTEFLLDDVLDTFKEPALIDSSSNETFTYGKLKEMVNDMAIQYYIRGWEQTMPIAVAITPNHRIYPITVLAAARLGMPTVLIDPSQKAREMARQMKLTNVNNIITHNSIIQYIRDATATLRNIKEILVIDKEDELKDKKDVRWSMEMKYNLLFGKPPGWGAIPDWKVTTNLNMVLICAHTMENGEPTLKASALVQKAISSTILAIKSIEPDLTKSDVFISALPLHNILSLTFNLYPFFIGAKSVILDNYELTKFVSLVQQHKITFAHMSPNQIKELAENDSVIADHFSSLKTVIVGEQIDIEIIDKFEDKFKNTKVKQVYTMNTLTPPLMYTPTNKIKKGSVGILLPGVEAKVIDPVSGAELDVNCEGDLHIRGPQMMSHLISVLLRPDAPKK